MRLETWERRREHNYSTDNRRFFSEYSDLHEFMGMCCKNKTFICFITFAATSRLTGVWRRLSIHAKTNVKLKHLCCVCGFNKVNIINNLSLKPKSFMPQLRENNLQCLTTWLKQKLCRSTGLVWHRPMDAFFILCWTSHHNRKSAEKIFESSY